MESSSAQGVSVFVVDDERDMAQLLSAGLRLAGYRVRAFSDPREAIKALGTERPDVVVTDMKMPAASGLEVLAATRDLLPDSGVVIVSGYADEAEARAALDGGAFAFLTKPVPRRKLAEAIERFLASRTETAGDG